MWLKIITIFFACYDAAEVVSIAQLDYYLSKPKLLKYVNALTLFQIFEEGDP